MGLVYHLAEVGEGVAIVLLTAALLGFVVERLRR